MKIDDLLHAHVGNFGRFQVLVLVLILAPGILMAFNIMEIIFMVKEPRYWCHVSVGENAAEELAGLSVEEKVEILSPHVQGEDGPLDACKVLDVNFTSVFFLHNSTSLTITSNQTVHSQNGTVGSKPCHAWNYDEQTTGQTLVSRFDLVCDRVWLTGLAKSVQLFGQLVGVFFGGVLTDRFGRRPVARCALLLSCVVRVAMSFSPILEMFLVTRLISGASDLLYFTSVYVQVTEMLSAKRRALPIVLTATAFAIGGMIAPAVSYLLPHWTHMALANTVITTIICLPTLFVPESPRWLYCVGRVEEGKETLQKLAKFNAIFVPPETCYFLEMETQQSKGPGIFSFLHSSLVLFRLAITMYLWFSVSMLYYGIALNIGGLVGSIYINAVIMGAADLPACWLIQPLVNSCVGRRTPIGVGFLICSIALLADMAVARTSIVRTVFALIGKFALRLAFNTLYVITPEMFPTGMRGTAMGLSSALARVGSAISPFIALCPGNIPAITFGMAAAVASVAILSLPETRGQPFPSNVADMHKQQSLLCHCLEKKELKEPGADIDLQ